LPLVPVFSSGGGGRGWSPFVSFLASLALHAGGLTLALMVPSSVFQDPSVNLRLELAKRERPEKRQIIIWFRKGERLPLVDSGEAHEVKLPEARMEKRETIFTNPKPDAPKKQFIFTELPKVAVQPELPSPNVVSFAAPSVPVLPPPKPALKKYKAPPAQPRVPAPVVDLAEGIPAEGPAAKLEIPVSTPVVSAIDPKLMRAPAKKFVLPGGEDAGTGGAQKPVMDAPAGPTEGAGANGANAGTGTVTMAIISRFPTNMPQPPEVRGNRPDAIQIGGVPGGVKGGGEGGRGGAAIPGLTVRGDRNGETPAAAAEAPAASAKAGNGAGAVPTRPPALPPAAPMTVSVPQWPNSRRVPATVEAVFRDRPVFATVLTPPNGYPDWVLWFGDTGPAAPGVRLFMRPPVPRQLSWATGSDLGSGWPDRAWVKARLTREGTLTAITVSEGGQPGAAATIAQILGRWLFSPAIRNGEIIDADVLLEVSFGRPR
jgi:hypothetical protein